MNDELVEVKFNDFNSLETLRFTSEFGYGHAYSLMLSGMTHQPDGLVVLRFKHRIKDLEDKIENYANKLIQPQVKLVPYTDEDIQKIGHALLKIIEKE